MMMFALGCTMVFVVELSERHNRLIIIQIAIKTCLALHFGLHTAQQHDERRKHTFNTQLCAPFIQLVAV